MKRKISEEFKKARREMIERRTICHECEDYATELHHIVAVEDGGTDDIECKDATKNILASRQLKEFNHYGLKVHRLVCD